MAKLCPRCKERNELRALSCLCGFLFVNDIEALQTSEMAGLRHAQRGRTVKKSAVLFSAFAIFLVIPAYFGGFVPTEDEAEVRDDPRPFAANTANQTNQPFKPETDLLIDPDVLDGAASYDDLTDIDGETLAPGEPTGIPAKRPERQKRGNNPALSAQPSQPPTTAAVAAPGNTQNASPPTSQPAQLVPERIQPTSNPKPAITENTPSPPVKTVTPPSPARTYTLGPRGGCYYITAKGNKSYVDRSKCQ